MKKIFTLIALLLGAVAGFAADYTDDLTVLINGQGGKQPATISVEQQENGNYLLTLKNFAMFLGGETMAVGNIAIVDVPGVEANNATYLETEQTITITNGDDPNVVMWMGPLIGPVPVALKAEIRGDKLYAIIDINLASMGQVVQVVFGTGGYQIPNSDFEAFHDVALLSEKGATIASGVEPDGWHSFLTGSADMANGTSMPAILQMACAMGSHVFADSITRPGSNGNTCLQLKSCFALIAIANGTITTGRLNAASAMVSKDASSGQWLNHSWNDMSQTELAPDSLPFYAEINGRPDSIAVWMKFTPSKDYDKAEGYANHPFASLNAVINDGTYYQDPEQTAPVTGDIRPTEYHGVVAKAQNRTIAEGDWQRIVVPFDYATYEADKAEGKVVLVTASTNAEAACGGKNDELLLDDMELIYNCAMTGLRVAGQDIDLTQTPATLGAEPTAENVEVLTDAAGARTTVSIDAEAKTINVRVLAGDLRASNSYAIAYTVDSNAIGSVKAGSTKAAQRYNLAGQKADGAKGIVIEGGKKLVRK